MLETSILEVESALFTTTLVERAFQSILLELENFLSQQEGRVAIAFQVLDPCATIVRVPKPVVIWTGIVGETNPEKWKSNYMENAGKKAAIVWRTGKSTRQIQTDFPMLFEKNDFKYGGGVSYKSIIGGASGLSQEQDDHCAMRLVKKCYDLVLEVAAHEIAKPEHHILEATS